MIWKLISTTINCDWLWSSANI